jgi:glycosyltransferase involved in cell wall biosynthesis
MKILVLMYNAATRGGLQYPTRTLLEYLAQCGHDVHLASNTVPDDWQGVRTHIIPFSLTGFAKRIDYFLNGIARRVPWNRLQTILKPAGLIPEYTFPRKAADHLLGWENLDTYDVIIVPQHFCGDGARRLSARIGLPFVVIGHGHVFGFPWQSLGLLRYLYYLRATKDSYRYANSVIVVGRRMLNNVLRYRKSQEGVYHIPNGVNLDQFNSKISHSQKPDSTAQILFVGRLEYEKGVQYLLPALARLKDVNFRCTLVGAGSQIGRYQRLATQLGLSDRCDFVGAVAREQVAACYQKAHLCVIPSLTEGHPSVLIEAMASGVPVVGTEIVGIEDVIVPGENGLLVPPRNSDQLAQAIRKMINSPELREQFAKNGLNTVKQYEWKTILPRLEKAICETVERSQNNKISARSSQRT